MRLRVDHLRHGHSGAHQPHQINLFLAERSIVFVDAQDHRLGRWVKLQLEIRVAQTIAERLAGEYAAAWERGVCDALQNGRGQAAARLGAHPAGLIGRAGNHITRVRASEPASLQGSVRGRPPCRA